jgi:hypothetical protein
VLKTLELINYARVARVRVVPRVASRTLELINYARVARVRVVRVVASRTYKLRARSARSSRVRSLTGEVFLINYSKDFVVTSGSFKELIRQKCQSFKDALRTP